VDYVGARPCRNVWMQSFLFLLSCLSSCVTVLNNLFLSGVHNSCQPVLSLLSSIFCLINIGQSYA
jgi:hypothetical protein